jgi:hypothetical protein
MATKLKVIYNDGREMKILASPRAQVETERHFRGQGIAQINRVEAGFHLAWASLHYAGKESADFETWLDTVADAEEIELEEADEQATDPTPATPEPTGSFV